MDAPALARAARQQQIRLRALTLRQLLALWPIWQVEDADSFPLFAAAVLPLIRERHRDSATLAVASYQALRLAEGVPGRAEAAVAPFDEARAITSLYVTGQVLTDRAIRSGVSAAAARETALVRVSGAAARLVLEGGRETLRLTGQRDPRQTGWRRVTGGNSCDWCRGKAADAASNPAAAFGGHDHCACTPAPRF